MTKIVLGFGGSVLACLLSTVIFFIREFHKDVKVGLQSSAARISALELKQEALAEKIAASIKAEADFREYTKDIYRKMAKLSKRKKKVAEDRCGSGTDAT